MRKTVTVTITAEGRDHGKVFELREMPAAQAEKWAMRAFLALGRSGVEIPAGVEDVGMAGFAVLGLKALTNMRYDDAEPLLDEMWQCVRIIPDPGRPEVSRVLVDDDIEEVATRLKLRAEVFTLHTGFTLGATPSTSISDSTTLPDSSSIPTSPVSSAPSSRPERRR